MQLDPQELKNALVAKKINNLYHANTVATAANFFRCRKLLSRKRVEQLGLPQTAQTSDEIDKKLGIWDLLFVDSVDIHKRAKRQNAYGPVLFELRIDVLDGEEINWVSVTKKNPTEWNQYKNQSERWFASVEEFRKDFREGRFEQMIVFNCKDGELHIHNSLEKVTLDNPEVSAKGKIDLYSLGLGALAMARFGEQVTFASTS